MIRLLDGPVGTLLERRGFQLDPSQWSAPAVHRDPELISQIHRDYADAGATIHTSNTFRTKHRNVGDRWLELTQNAVRLSRDSVPNGHLVAGSIAPLNDCYRPDLSPVNAFDEHLQMAHALKDAGCDLLLCETFANVWEAVQAVQAGVKVGMETWVSFSAGPEANLISPAQVGLGARKCVDVGATAVLVNCIPSDATHAYVKAIADRKLNVPIGAYANAGMSPDGTSWNEEKSDGAAEYLGHAQTWVNEGATIIGGCCGTGPEHILACKELVG